MTSGPRRGSSASDNSILLAADIGDRVILGGTQRGAALALSSVMGAAGAVIVLRHLGVSAVGRYGTVMSLIGMVYGLSDLGLTVTGVRELALCDTDEQQETLLSHILGIRIAITALAVGVATAFSAAVGYPGAMVMGTALAGIGVILQSAQAAIVLPLSVRMRNGVLAVNQVLQQLTLLLGFALAAALGGEIVAFCAVQILVGAVLLSAAPWLLGRHAIARPRFSSEHTYAVIRTGLPIAVASVVGVLYVRVLVIFMSLLTNQTGQVGYFVTSSRVVELAAGVPFLVIGVMLPVATAVARSERDRLVYMTGRLAQFMLLAGTAASLLLWTLAPTILRVAGGAQYVGGTQVLQIQGFALITVFVGASWQTALIGMGRLRSLAGALGGGLIALIVSGAVLIPRFQADGAAWATVAGEVVLCTLLYISVRRAAPGDWLPRRAACGVVLSALLAVMAGVLVTGPVILRAMLVVGMFAGGAVLMRTIPSEILDAALTRLGRSSDPANAAPGPEDAGA